MSFELQLHGGRTISLHALVQTHTYAGLMEGLPTAEMNQRLMSAAVSEAERRWHDQAHLVIPDETPIEWKGGHYPFGTPGKIPEIQCLSRWRSSFESLGDRDGWFELTVISYQEKFALPFAPEVIVAILDLDWDRLATFHEF